MVRKLLLCGLVTATTALPLVPANASAPHAPVHLPVRWQAPSATTLNEPALAANRVVTTADNIATARGLFHGHVLWRKTIPDEEGFHISLGSPTASGDQVDAVIDAAGG